VQQVRTALDKLKSTQEITIKTTNKYTVVTIANWEDYQSTEENVTSKSTGRATNEQQTNNKQITNNQQQRKNDKECKEGKECKELKDNKASSDAVVSAYTQNQQLKTAIIDFLQMRKSIKAKMTDRALELMLSKLDKLGQDDAEKIHVLEQSTMNSWKGIFELKGGSSNGANKGNTGTPASPVKPVECEGDRLHARAIKQTGGKIEDTEYDF